MGKAMIALTFAGYQIALGQGLSLGMDVRRSLLQLVRTIEETAFIWEGTWRRFCVMTTCLLLAAVLVGCSGGEDDLTGEEETLGAEKALTKTGAAFPDKEQWTKEEWAKEKGLPVSGDTVLERTVAMVEGFGGEIHYVDHPGRGDRTILVTPLEFLDGETPLIVSLHGFGGNSADMSAYVPLHERVNPGGFALLIPNGTVDGDGNRFWNPTDECCDGGKSGEDDVAYLTELVEEARRDRDFGQVYFFGYSNGGFMAHHIACKGLPGLRAVVSLAGTSYVEEASCEGAPPVSALHIHGTDDGVILYEGIEAVATPGGKNESAFYVGAEEMAKRWSRRAGCEWPDDMQPYAILDMDQLVDGVETRAFRAESGCANGISVELWMGEGSGHAPGIGEAFVDAVLTWLLAQE